MDADQVVARRFAPVVQAYDARDGALYALALGYGHDPLDEDVLRYVVEGGDGRAPQRVVPSWPVTLGWPPFWQREPATGIDWVRILHGEQHLVVHAPLPLEATVRATHRVAGIEDKGVGHGALVHFDTELHDAASGVHHASLRSVQFLRGDGGCGSRGESRPGLPPIPDDAMPTTTVVYPTLPQGALLYRLASRDLMPLHADPRVARAAGFERPIAHGLNAFGIACRAIVERYAPGAPERVREMAVRFARPMVPGESIRIELFDAPVPGPDGEAASGDALQPGPAPVARGESASGDALRPGPGPGGEAARGGHQIRFRARAVERDVVVLDRGRCRLERLGDGECRG